MSYYDDPGCPGGRMCEACEHEEHWNCGMQTWCECDCSGPDGVYAGHYECQEPCGNITAEVLADHQHGPIVTVCVDDVRVSIYLADETGIVTRPAGQYGIEVNGPWHYVLLGWPHGRCRRGNSERKNGQA